VYTGKRNENLCTLLAGVNNLQELVIYVDGAKTRHYAITDYRIYWHFKDRFGVLHGNVSISSLYNDTESCVQRHKNDHSVNVMGLNNRPDRNLSLCHKLTVLILDKSPPTFKNSSQALMKNHKLYPWSHGSDTPCFIVPVQRSAANDTHHFT
jgi:hypothetical protein